MKKQNKNIDGHFISIINGIPAQHKFKSGEYEEYKAICELIWGGCPLDLTWARETNLYKEAKEKYEQEKKNS